MAEAGSYPTGSTSDGAAKFLGVDGSDAVKLFSASALRTEFASYSAIDTFTSANRDLVPADAGTLVESNRPDANTITVPANADAAIPLRSRIDVVQYGVGQTSIVAAAGVTIRSEGGKLKVGAQYTAVTLYKRAANEWLLIGNLVE